MRFLEGVQGTDARIGSAPGRGGIAPFHSGTIKEPIMAQEQAVVESALSLAGQPDTGWAKFWGGQVFPTAEEFKKLEYLAKTAISSGIVPRGIDTPQKAIIILMDAREVGIPPMTALKGGYPVNGKVAYEGWIALTLIRQRVKGAILKFIEKSEAAAIIDTWRPGDQTDEKGNPIFTRYEFTAEDAISAGLNVKDTYKKYPIDMLLWRAVGRMKRFHYPDVTSGAPLVEEIEYIPPDKPIDPPSGPKPEIAEATSTEDGVVLPKLTPVRAPSASDLDKPHSTESSAPASEPELVEEVPPIPFGNGPDVVEDDGLTPTAEEKASMEASKAPQNPPPPPSPSGDENTPEKGDSYEPTAEELDNVVLDAMGAAKNILGLNLSAKQATPPIHTRAETDPLRTAFCRCVNLLLDAAKDMREINAILNGLDPILRLDSIVAYYRSRANDFVRPASAKPTPRRTL